MWPEREDGWITVDCDFCPRACAEACADCPVTFIGGREVDDALVIDVAEVRALRALQEAGFAAQVVRRYERPANPDRVRARPAVATIA